jgi:[CysO sulfur-carrier protein]-S-L-cysteine hydrolase
MTLTLSKDIYNDMVEHATSLAPIESCGYLAGKDGVVETFYKMTNVDNSPEHFSFDPKEQFQVVKAARKAGLKLLSVYHSHPETPARLSEEDITLFNDPEPVYIIVSLKNEEADMKGYYVRKPSENEIEISRVELIVN